MLTYHQLSPLASIWQRHSSQGIILKRSEDLKKLEIGCDTEEASTWRTKPGINEKFGKNSNFGILKKNLTGAILGMGSAKGRRHYIVMPPLIGWTQAQNDLCFTYDAPFEDGW